MILIGITGTNGSGKGACVSYLVEQKKFKQYAVRDYLTEEIKKRGMPIDRSSMRLVANELRERHEPAFIVKELYKRAVEEGSRRVIIESIRNTGEAKFLHEHGAILLAIDAEKRVRFERIQERRSPTDQVDFKTFCFHEEREMCPVGPHDMDVRGVMDLAEYTIMNDGDILSLYNKIDDICRGIL